MTAATVNLHIARGVTLGPIQMQCNDASGNPVNLTGWSAFAQVRLNPGAPMIADLAPVITNPSGGQITIAQTAAQTAAMAPGEFSWDLLLERPTGEILGPYIAGNCVISRTITHLT